MEEHRAGADSGEGRGQGRRSAFWILWLVLAGVFYVLSVGPVAKLNDKGLIPDSVGVIYEPLGWASDRVPPLDQFLDWYLKLWGVK